MLGLVRELARDPIEAARLYGKAAIPVGRRILSGVVERAWRTRSKQTGGVDPFILEGKSA